jgi:A/G-specific adenine glycosylase
MLQQTQVAQVVPYYERFLHAFPTVQRLAAAPLERVLEMWSGMGYYRRARNLHLAAKSIRQNFGGRFPREYQQARTLPGVGDYTARAVLSIAYDAPYFVLDGNVARVMARLYALEGSLSQRSFRGRVERGLDRLLSRRQPGGFNQALMELGQTVCLPRGPRCSVCPLAKWCRAFRRGRPELYPVPRPRRATELRYLAAAVIRRGAEVALVRGLDEGLLIDLWNFPSAFGKTRAEALVRLREKLDDMTRGSILWDRNGAPPQEVRHGITHRSIRVHLYPAECSGNTSRRNLRWIALTRFPQAAISQLARKIAAKLA